MRHRSARAATQQRAAIDRRVTGLLVLAVAFLTAACGNADASRTNSVPEAVVRAGITLEHGSVPEHLEHSVRPLPDGVVSPADHANGVIAGFTVDWRGIDRRSDGHTQDVQGSFSVRHLASGNWYLTDGGEGQVLLTSDGAIATTDEDFSGVYRGRTEAHGYDGIEMTVQRSGTTHAGTFRYRYFGSPRTVRILALHRLVARDPYVQELNGVVQLWACEDDNDSRTSVLPVHAVDLRPDGIAFTWIPPREPVVVTLRRQ